MIVDHVWDDLKSKLCKLKAKCHQLTTTAQYDCAISELIDVLIQEKPIIGITACKITITIEECDHTVDSVFMCMDHVDMVVEYLKDVLGCKYEIKSEKIFGRSINLESGQKVFITPDNQCYNIPDWPDADEWESIASTTHKQETHLLNQRGVILKRLYKYLKEKPC